jgi:hypothetical protein
MHLAEEPGKQKPRSRRVQELARAVPRENERQKKRKLPDSLEIVWRREQGSKRSVGRDSG